MEKADICPICDRVNKVAEGGSFYIPKEYAGDYLKGKRLNPVYLSAECARKGLARELKNLDKDSPTLKEETALLELALRNIEAGNHNMPRTCSDG